MMNNVSATNMSQTAPSAAIIMKAASQPTTLPPSSQQQQQAPSQITLPQGSIIPAAIIASNAINNANSTITPFNTEPSGTIASTPVNAFTILNPTHPTQSLQATITNNLVSVSNVQPTSIQTANATSLIASATIGNTVTQPVICTAGGPLNTASVQQVSIPVGVTVGSTVSVLKPGTAGLHIGQRFQTANVMTTTGSTASPISTVFIQQTTPQQTTQQHAASQPSQAPEHLTGAAVVAAAAAAAANKNQTVTHSVAAAATAHHPTHLNSVINAVSVAGPTVTVHQSIPPAHSAPLFIHTSNASANNASAILHSNVNIVAPNAPVAAVASTVAQHQQQQPASATPSQSAGSLSTINLTTSTAHQQQPTPPTQQAPLQSQQQPPSQQQQQFQRLKVEDALSYLDQVKFKFNDQPQVYNDFLDIMKEFKSQSIDTPGVIQRVSNLFRGHSELIVGFNTFLPPGYKIEIHSNEMNVSMPNSNYTVLMTTNTNLPPQQINHSHAPVATVTPTTIVSGGTNAVHQISGNLPRNALVTIPTNTTSQQPLLPAAHPPAPSSFSNALHSSREPNHAPTTPAIHVNNLPQPAALNRSDSTVNVPGGASVHLNHRTSHVIDISSKMSAHAQPALPNDIDPQSNAQPVEFNHAISYVNKIKNRFLHQPEIYKQFLDILQSYQKEQLSIKEGNPPSGQKSLTESEVYAQVAKLFQNQEDLLEEFSQFLPDANGGSVSHHSNSSLLNASNQHTTMLSSNSLNSIHNTHPQSHIDNAIGAAFANSISTADHNSLSKSKGGVGAATGPVNIINASAPNRTSSISSSNSFSNLHRVPKRSSNSISISGPMEQPNSQHVATKRSKLTPTRDNSMAEASKYMGDLSEYAFYDKLRNALSSNAQYDHFLRVLSLFNNDLICKAELLQMVSPAFCRSPELLKKFKELIGLNSGPNNSSQHGGSFPAYNSFSSYNLLSTSLYGNNHLEGLGGRMLRDHPPSVAEKEIDVNAGKRYGASYRSVVKPPQECSGRTDLCREVLNDTLVSFPSWSEDSTFVSSRKTPYQDQLHQAEDERFELDLVLETNLATIRVLETVLKKIERLPSEEKANLKLDDTLGGSSKVLHQLAIRRIYGDKANDVIEGLKNSPANVVPIVLRRLMSKEEEWREQQRIFNKHWRELNEKCYLKSLDHQGITFKQNDAKYMKPKALLTEIEDIMGQRETSGEQNFQTFSQPHMVFVYPDKSMIEVASNLIIHHVKRLTAAHKEDKQKIKQLLRHFIPDLFDTPRGVLSDDDADDDEPSNILYKHSDNIKKTKESSGNGKPSNGANTQGMLNSLPDEEYALYFINENWYYFFRLHYILCERLSKMNHRAKVIAEQETAEGTDKNGTAAVLLRLKNNRIDTHNYFNALVDMVTQVMDGNLDSNQYEDNLREMFGIHAFVAFTLDKVVQNIVRQLQLIVGDEEGTQCIELYLEALKKDGAGGLCLTAQQRIEQEAEYHKNAEQTLVDDNCFKLIVYKNEGKITVELLESPEEEEEESSNEADEESNQSSRTLRSSTKNMADSAGVDEAKVTERVNERIKANPLFINREITRFKKLYSKKSDNLHSKDSKSNDKEEELGDKGDNGSYEKDGDKPENDLEKECKFSLKNYKRVFVVFKEGVFCKGALKDAKRTHKNVTRQKYSKFSKWHSEWSKVNVPTKSDELYKTWMLLPDNNDFKFDDSDLNNNKKESTTTTITTTTTTAILTTTSNESSFKPSTTGGGTTTPLPDGKEVEIKEEMGNETLSKIIDDKSATSQSKAPTSKKLSSTFQIERLEIEASDSKTPYRSYCRYLRKSL